MAKDLQAKVEQLAAQLEQRLGDNLVAFCLYGPAVRHDTRDGDKALTTLLIVRDASPLGLRPIEQPIADWAKKGNPPPLVFAEQGWHNSTDVFPIEIEDMREAHQILRGTDPFTGLTTTREDLRTELEREVRGKLLRLRTEFVAAAPKGKALEELLLDSAGTFFVLFRAVLRLAGQEPPQTPKTLVHETADVAGLDAAAFDWVLDKLVGHNVPSLKAYDPIGDRYVEQIEQLARFVDTYDTTGAQEAPKQENGA
ncbi:MAG: hypothetical protein PVH40_02920 [Gemmatimonadales bacterium]